MTATNLIDPSAVLKQRFAFPTSSRAKLVADWGQNAIADTRRWGGLSSNEFTVEVLWNGTFVELWETAVWEQHNASYRKCLSDQFLAGGGTEVAL